MGPHVCEYMLCCFWFRGLVFQRQFVSPPRSHVTICQPLLDLLSSEPPPDPQRIPPLLPLHLPLTSPSSLHPNVGSALGDSDPSSFTSHLHLPPTRQDHADTASAKPGADRGTGALFQIWKTGLFYVAVVESEVSEGKWAARLGRCLAFSALNVLVVVLWMFCS